MHPSRKIEFGFFFVLVTAVAILSFLLLKPYLGALFMAVVFVIVFRPVYEAIQKRLNRPSLSSLLTLVFLFCVILTPAAFFGYFVFDDAQNLYFATQRDTPIVGRLALTLQPLESVVQRVIPSFEINLTEYSDAALSFFLDNFGSVFSRVVGMVFQTGIMLLALFFLFRDGAVFRRYIVVLSPLANEYDERILKRLEGAISSVVKGRLLIVLVQGVLSALGFWLFGVPHAVLWGAMISLTALIPAVGVAIVFVPMILYMFLTGGVAMTIGLAVFAVFVGAIDNLLGPVLFEKGLQMHPLFILLSVFGGLVFFGPIGFLAGPVTLALLLALLDIYPLLFQEKGQ